MSPGIAAAARLLAITAVDGGGARSTGERVALVGGTVIDGTGRAPVKDAVVFLQGARIAAVGPRDRVPVPAGTRVLDAAGRWIVPGFIDAHVHFAQSGGLYSRPDVIDLRGVRPYYQEVAGVKRRLQQTFARYLASGVTSVVDTGGPLWNFEMRRMAGEARLAPRVIAAGPLLARSRPAALDVDDPPVVVVTTAAQGRAAVRLQLVYRTDLVAVRLSGNEGHDAAENAAWVAAVIDESHAGGVPVAVHATELDTARGALRAGADVLVRSVADRPVDQDFIGLLRARRVPCVTALATGEACRRVLAQRDMLSEMERRIGDPDVIATFGRETNAPGEGDGSAAQPCGPLPAENLQRIVQAGGTVASGSDAGNIGMLHGPALHRELELMARGGLAPMAILVAATGGAALVTGRAHEVGTLEPGKLADIVVLDADPLLDIRNSRRIHRVVKGGELFDPEWILEGLPRYR